MFLRLSEGIDDGTWVYHLRNGDYSKWFREKIKDDELASEAELIEADKNLSSDESRKLIMEKIKEKYTGRA
jgi:hypothetical protein